MSSRDVDTFLAESQDVLDDHVTWHGSADSATWAADGSHEYDTGGEGWHYDRPHRPRREPTDDEVRDFVKATFRAIRNGYSYMRRIYIARLRHITYATDIHGRPSRVRAVWDNPFSQEDR